MTNVINDLAGLKQAIEDLLKDNFYAPDLVEEPAFRKNPPSRPEDLLRARDDWLRKNYNKDEVVLSKDYKLVKDYTESYFRCRSCVCGQLFFLAPEDHKDNFKFNCNSMPCHEPDFRLENTFFRLVRTATKSEGYKPDTFDFSDWAAIKRATGF